MAQDWLPQNDGIPSEWNEIPSEPSNIALPVPIDDGDNSNWITQIPEGSTMTQREYEATLKAEDYANQSKEFRDQAEAIAQNSTVEYNDIVARHEDIIARNTAIVEIQADVNQTYIDTTMARDTALGAAVAAQTAQSGAETAQAGAEAARDLAEQYRDETLGGNVSDGVVTIPKLAPDTVAFINTKAPINNPTFTGTVGGISKAMVGLGSADNTSDLAKPISTLTQGALDLKANISDVAANFAPLASPVFTGNPTAPTPATADNDTSIATTKFVKDQAYAPLANPTFSGNPNTPNRVPADGGNSIANLSYVNVYGKGGAQGVRLVWFSTTQMKTELIEGGVININGTVYLGLATTINASAGTINAINYVYAYISGTSVAYEVSTTAPTVYTTFGYMCKAGDTTRHLIGAFWRWSDGFIYDDTARRTTVSYYGRRSKLLVSGVAGGAATASTSIVAISAAAYAVLWEDQAVKATLSGYAYNLSLFFLAFACVLWDSLTTNSYEGGGTNQAGNYTAITSVGTRVAVGSGGTAALVTLGGGGRTNGVSATFSFGVEAEVWA